MSDQQLALDKPADISTIRKLNQDGLLSDEAFIVASKILRPSSDWFSWARQMLLFVGSALVLAGIIFFFAYNWNEMGRFLKFGLIEASIIGCVVASYLQERTKITAKVLLLSASVLVGVLLAVYGQAYQTGADAYGLFIAWAVLIFGWVVISEFAALWLLWLIILNVGMVFYWEQVGRPVHDIPHEFLYLALAVLNSVSLWLCESGRLMKFEWLRDKWLQGLLLVAVLVLLSVPTFELIVDVRWRRDVSFVIAFMWLAAVIGGYFCYRYKLRDIQFLALIMMDACFILLTLIGKILFHDISFHEALSFLVFGLIILVTVSVAAFWLKKIAASMEIELKGATHEQE